VKPEPFSFQHPVSDFDLAKLPVDAALVRENPKLLESAVQTYYEELFRKMGGSATIVVKGDVVSVAWYPEEGDAQQLVFDRALVLLRQGDYKTAEPLLRVLLTRNPDHADVLYNLGMMLSDQRRLTEALTLLQRFVELAPDDSNGWTALGLAYSRNGDMQEGVTSLRKALEIAPDNAYALRNLGAILSQQSPQEALPLLERAAQLMPEDQAAQNGCGQCLLALGRSNEADTFLLKAIQLNPLSEVAEAARSARTSIAHRNMRSAVGGGPRPDAMFYCLDGLKKFREMGDARMRAVVYEIAMLGHSGLDINDPAQKYTLRSLPGKYSGLHLVSLMYTGLRLIDPKADAGINLSKEFAAAEGMLGGLGAAGNTETK